MSYFVYLLECSDGTYYCGYTCDLNKRLAAHNCGKGSKYVRARRPARLAYNEKFSSQAKAMRRELAIKKLSRAQKEKLVFGE